MSKFWVRLTEDTRTVLINASKNKGMYKNDTGRGKNRYERRKYSHIANAVKQYNQINMNSLFKSDILEVKIPVVGETSEYTVTVKMEGVIEEIKKNVKNNKNMLEYRTIIQALTKVFNTANIYLNCTCPDFKYTYKHWAIINNISTEGTSDDPGLGKGIKNPNDEEGKGCKHILLVLSNCDWLMKVASVINNYINYMADNNTDPFLKLIFPKLYGIPADEMVEQDLIDDDAYLDSSKGLINAINEYGKNRGKYQKGSNKNPVTNTGGRQKISQKEEKEE